MNASFSVLFGNVVWRVLFVYLSRVSGFARVAFWSVHENFQKNFEQLLHMSVFPLWYSFLFIFQGTAKVPWFFYGCFIERLCYVGFVLSFFDRTSLRLIFVYHCACCALRMRCSKIPSGFNKNCSVVSPRGTLRINLAVLRIRKIIISKNGREDFLGMRRACTPLFWFQQPFAAICSFRRIPPQNAKSDAFIREIVINRVYKRFPKAGGVLTAKPSLSANTVK